MGVHSVRFPHFSHGFRYTGASTRAFSPLFARIQSPPLHLIGNGSHFPGAGGAPRKSLPLPPRMGAQHVAGQKMGVFLPRRIEHVLSQNNGELLPEHVLVMLEKTKSRDFCLRQNRFELARTKFGDFGPGHECNRHPNLEVRADGGGRARPGATLGENGDCAGALWRERSRASGMTDVV